jgi:hypothetical protein
MRSEQGSRFATAESEEGSNTSGGTMKHFCVRGLEKESGAAD